MILFEGKWLDERSRDMFVRLRWRSGLELVITQGSYSTGVKQSGGTHDGGGVFDIRARDLTNTEAGRVVLMARQMGGAAWLRNPDQGDWPWHIHCVLMGCTDLSPAARNQVSAYKDGYNGLGHLGRGGPDDGPRGYQNTTWEAYQAAHPDEEWEMSVGDDILAKLNEIHAQVVSDTRIDVSDTNIGVAQSDLLQQVLRELAALRTAVAALPKS